MKKYLSAPQVAKKVGVTRAMVVRWIKQGKIQAIRVGRSYAIEEKEVERVRRIRELGLWR